MKKQDSWIISGKEAEALHLEEEDFSENEEQSDEDEDPLKKIIQSRYLFYNFCHNTQIHFQDYKLSQIILSYVDVTTEDLSFSGI